MESVLDCQYLVKWKGFEKPSWEPFENLTNCDEVVSYFHSVCCLFSMCELKVHDFVLCANRSSVLQRLERLSLPPSSPLLSWTVVSEMADIQTT